MFTLEVLDLIGRVLLSEKIAGGNIFELDVLKFTSGVYLIRMDGKEMNTKVYKFIKE